MPAVSLLVLTGLGVGVVFGLFGAGGSALATPLLALLGVPPILAVATPLPATLPAAIGGAWAYRRRGDVDVRTAVLAVAGGAPMALFGALVSRLVGGRILLLLSGALLAMVGARMLRPSRSDAGAGEGARHLRPAVIVAAAGGVGFLTGLLANGGGFLLLPLFLIGLQLGMRKSAGTSLAVVAAMSVPTLATHWALGHIDWGVSAALAAGLIPGSAIGARVSGHIHPERTQRAFAVILLAFAAWFILR